MSWSGEIIIDRSNPEHAYQDMLRAMPLGGQADEPRADAAKVAAREAAILLLFAEALGSDALVVKVSINGHNQAGHNYLNVSVADWAPKAVDPEPVINNPVTEVTGNTLEAQARKPLVNNPAAEPANNTISSEADARNLLVSELTAHMQPDPDEAITDLPDTSGIPGNLIENPSMELAASTSAEEPAPVVPTDEHAEATDEEGDGESEEVDGEDIAEEVPSTDGKPPAKRRRRGGKKN